MWLCREVPKTTLNIIARKPLRREFLLDDLEELHWSTNAEFVIVDISDRNKYHPFVVSTTTPESIANGEWYSGSYYETLDEALEDFNSR